MFQKQFKSACTLFFPIHWKFQIEKISFFYVRNNLLNYPSIFQFFFVSLILSFVIIVLNCKCRNKNLLFYTALFRALQFGRCGMILYWKIWWMFSHDFSSGEFPTPPLWLLSGHYSINEKQIERKILNTFIDWKTAAKKKKLTKKKQKKIPQ